MLALIQYVCVLVGYGFPQYRYVFHSTGHGLPQHVCVLVVLAVLVMVSHEHVLTWLTTAQLCSWQ